MPPASSPREVFVSHLQALPDQLCPILVRIQHEHEALGFREDPTQPGGKGLTQGVGQRAWDMPSGEVPVGTHINDLSSLADESPDLVHGEGREAGPASSVDLSSPPVDLSKAEEVVGIAPQAAEKGTHELVFVCDREDRVRGLLATDLVGLAGLAGPAEALPRMPAGDPFGAPWADPGGVTPAWTKGEGTALAGGETFGSGAGALGAGLAASTGAPCPARAAMRSPLYAEIEVFIHLQPPPGRGGAENLGKTGWVGGNISLVALSSVTQSGDDL